MYGNSGSLSNWVFWRYAVFTAIIGGAASFFIPYYAIVTSGQNSVADLYSVGKIVMLIIVAVVRIDPPFILLDDSRRHLQATYPCCAGQSPTRV